MNETACDQNRATAIRFMDLAKSGDARGGS